MKNQPNRDNPEIFCPKADCDLQITTGYLFPKKERLFLRNRVETLFSKGKSFVVFPYRVIFYLEPVQEEIFAQRSQEGEENKFERKTTAYLPTAELLISVAKRRFKHAVDRNRCKRITREAYRLHKAPFLLQLEKSELHISIAFLLVSDKSPSLEEASNAIKTILSKLIGKTKKYAFKRNNLS